MKKRITYQPSVEIRTTSEVITAKCTCPAGSTPAYCKHVFALLHAIVDYVSKELFYASTERLLTWHHPKPAKTISQEANKIFAGESSKRKLQNTNFDCDQLHFCPFLEAKRNAKEVIFDKTILLPAAVCSRKCSENLPALGMDATFFYHKNYFQNMEELLILEKRTVGQNCSEWHQERKLRLTASDMKTIVSRVSYFESLATQI
ncbi:SWIM-type domain-containing protein [Trichonephila clavata]|uniref:SWIM-type domain-containing protein n=1 Tax=Trichonephila clavata TaxID=2740835 RepID=A0A8X6L529_TRICU|nr:SWIM-type domain-containing protein [Trichonephila clavata]